MDKDKVVSFFDACAGSWDDELIRNDDVIATILNIAEVKENSTVLDVACGTGVLFPDYLKRKVAAVDAIDISAQMVKKAKAKYPQINVICGDAEEYCFYKEFDCIIIYNAFPHFISQENIIKVMAGLLNDGGILTVAHGMSKADLDTLHYRSAHNVSQALPEAEELASIFSKYLFVKTVISNDKMYQVTGKKN